MKRNYFVAAFLAAFGAAPSWIANFGVVPLLRSAALRLAPIARCFALRRASVTAVRDAMRYSWSIQKLSPLVVAVLLGVVKEARTATSEDLILAKGEQREIPLQGLKNYSIGNKEVLSGRVHQGKMLIKGRQVGFSDVVVWDAQGRHQFQVYILSKTSFLKTIQLAETLKDLGLTLNLKGQLMVVSGEITSAETWRYLHHLRRQHQDRVVFQAEAAPELRRFIASDIYRELFKSGVTRVSCQLRFLDVDCTHEAHGRAKEVMQTLELRWGARFMARESRWAQGNLRLKLKLIQFEGLDGQEISFGFSALRAKPLDLFNHGLKKLIEDNEVALAENHITLSTLAEPEALVRLDKPHTIEVGAQIPFQNVSQGQGVVLAPIDWRFAGLKLTTLLSERDGLLALDFETEFTRPSDGGISGSKEKSSVIVKPGMTYKLFHIGYQSRGEDRKHLPGLKDVPLLRVLFGSRGKQSTYKRIEGYLMVEEAI